MAFSNNDSKNDIDEVQHGRLALKVLSLMMGGGIIALAVMATDSPGFSTFCRTLSVAALSAGAFAFIGALLGFVFGIPRTLQKESTSLGHAATTSTEPRQAQFRHNTNLEDISDWLTKILVGVGLTQLTRLPEQLWSLAGAIAPGLGSGNHAQILALSTVVYYSAAGFIFAYLWTPLVAFVGGGRSAGPFNRTSRATPNARVGQVECYPLSRS